MDKFVCAATIPVYVLKGGLSITLMDWEKQEELLFLCMGQMWAPANPWRSERSVTL